MKDLSYDFDDLDEIERNESIDFCKIIDFVVDVNWDFKIAWLKDLSHNLDETWEIELIDFWKITDSVSDAVAIIK